MTRIELIEHIKKIHRLSSVSAVLEWDQETYMPAGGVEARSQQLSLLAGLTHELKTKPEFIQHLKSVALETCTEDEKVIFSETLKDVIKAEKCSKELIEKIAKAQSLGQAAWAEAKETNDYEYFKPYLSNMIDLKKEYAAAIGYSEHMYDALLDDYEPGATVKEIDPIFSDLRHHLVELLSKIKTKHRQIDRSLLKHVYDLDAQEEFALDVIERFGFNFENGRVDETVHPFCTNFSSKDVRITTAFNENDFREALYSLMHEAGHGIYEQGFNAEYDATPLAAPISLGIHESQSRLWENIIGRSATFWTAYFKGFKELYKKELKNLKFDQLMLFVNEVKPSLIRIEADEVTYNLHVMIRYEIEKAIFSGELSVNDIPDVWNKKYEEYLGVKPSTDSEGCLQDVHWSFGLFGYFPTYALGNLYSAQFYNAAQKALPYLDSEMEKGNFKSLKHWLNEHIHRHGKRYSVSECLKRVTGEPLNPEYFINYLNEKYTKLYHL